MTRKIVLATRFRARVLLITTKPRIDLLPATEASLPAPKRERSAERRMSYRCPRIADKFTQSAQLICYAAAHLHFGGAPAFRRSRLRHSPPALRRTVSEPPHRQRHPAPSWLTESALNGRSASRAFVCPRPSPASERGRNRVSAAPSGNKARRGAPASLPTAAPACAGCGRTRRRRSLSPTDRA
jgi:hypothetical protein